MNKEPSKMEGLQPSEAHVVGRPRTITMGETYELIALFKKGYSVANACNRSRIARSVFYAEMERNEEFRDRITAAREIMTTRATRIVEDSLRRNNLKAAMWWLDRMDRRERNAQRAKEYRLIKKLTVTKTYQETQSVELEVDTLID
jgi:hypothetical protein